MSEFNLKNDTVYIDNAESYQAFLTYMGINYGDNGSIFACIEYVEEFFGIQFGTNEQHKLGDVDVDNIQVRKSTLFPKEYPCLLLTYSMEGMTYLGNKSGAVYYSRYPVFVYKSDFKE